MHTEPEIRRAIRILLERYGQMTTSEIKEHMPEVMAFDDDDMIESNSRNGEIMILQRIGNVNSHQNKNEKIKVYDEGFQLDKTSGSDIYTLVKGFKGEENVITDKEKDKLRENLKNPPVRKIKKVDWDAENERRTEIGAKGEKFVYEILKGNVEKFNPASVNKVLHFSESQGDGAGFDIISIDEKGNSIYVEVKTTKMSEDTPFFMSENEKSFFEEHKDLEDAFIYRVYEFDSNKESGKYSIIPAKDLFEKYSFDPVSYKVEKK